MGYMNIILYSCFIGFVQCYNGKYCDDLAPYSGVIDLDRISGVWYGVEKIHHIEGEYKIEETNECFEIDIKEVYKQPNSTQGGRLGSAEWYPTRHLLLEWHEGLQQVDYHVMVKILQEGFWLIEIPNQPVNNLENFVGGIIQVLKATDNYLVLNFCMKVPDSQLYSVIVARDSNLLSPEDLADIHNIFSIKNLSTTTLKRVCQNAALTLSLPSMFLLTIWSCIIFIWRS